MIDYHEYILPLLNQGLDHSQIAARLTADPRRYPVVSMTAGAISAALAAMGYDGIAVVDRLIPALDAATQNSPTMRIVMADVQNGGTVDIGNPMVRQLIAQLATPDDANAVLGLVQVPPPVTAAVVGSIVAEHQQTEAWNANRLRIAAADEAVQQLSLPDRANASAVRAAWQT
ncbi:MAG: hypothetical protein AAFP90_18695, partial [Planctomycetota bacterium]